MDTTTTMMMMESPDIGMEMEVDEDGDLPAPSSIIVKWNGREEILIENVNELLLHNNTVMDLKLFLQSRTGVKVERQKLLNLVIRNPSNGKLKLAGDDCPLASTSLAGMMMRPGQKLMMVGSLEQDILNVDVPPEERFDVLNDFLDNPLEGEGPLETRRIYLDKIQGRIRHYPMQPWAVGYRPNKKLLVLGFDYTLFDSGSQAEKIEELQRPFLHEFLRSAWENNYNIVLWSATSQNVLLKKLLPLGMLSDQTEYKFLAVLDNLDMISVNTPKHGLIETKPLGVIWGQLPEYSARNTIMIDDDASNFLMNPKSGLNIPPYQNARFNRTTDQVLLLLGGYLKAISELEDFTKLDHSRWENFKNFSNNGGGGGGTGTRMEGGGGDSDFDYVDDDDDDEEEEEVAAKKPRMA